MASEFVSFVILFSLGITMVAAVGLTASNLESGVVVSVSYKELQDILKDVRSKLQDEINSISWQFSSSDYYFSSINIDLPNFLARRNTFTVDIKLDTNSNYFMEGTSGELGNFFSVIENLPFSSSHYTIVGGFNSILNNHNIELEKVGINPLTITFVSSNF